MIAPGKKKFRFKNKLFSLDATLIELCVSLFDWATYRQTKGAVKLHLLLDHDGYFPVFAHITDGLVHEINIAQTLSFPKGSIVVIDRGYVDYALFARWTTRRRLVRDPAERECQLHGHRRETGSREPELS